MTQPKSIRLGCLLCCLAGVPAVAEDDQVYMKRGAAVAGTIGGSTPVQIAIESRGQTQAIRVNEIRLVTFGDEPQELRQGRLPLWTPGVYMGYPLQAEGQAGVFSPVNLLLFVLLPDSQISKDYGKTGGYGPIRLRVDD